MTNLPDFFIISPSFSYHLSGEGAQRMERYVCLVCGYIYDPREGDPDFGVEPGTPFSKLPEDWICPVCGASKDQFERE